MAFEQYNVQPWLTAVRVVAASNQTATYYNGIGNTGLGATLTYATGVLTIDGVTLLQGDRVLIAGQTNKNENGIYVVATAGAVGVAAVLQRAADFQSIEQLKAGMYVSVAAGTSYAGSRYVLCETLPAQLGVSDMIWASNLKSSLALPDLGANLVSFDVTVGQAALAAGGSVTLYASSGTKQYKVRTLELESGGTNFSGGGGDRLGQVTDGTSVYSVIPAATMQSLVNARWGVTALPNAASVANNTSTVAGASLVFKYSGGTTDYTAGSLRISGLLERVA